MSNQSDKHSPDSHPRPRPSTAEADRSPNEAPVASLEKHVSEIVAIAGTWNATFAEFRGDRPEGAEGRRRR